MRISIVTICYNQVAYVERAIRSVIEQDYADKEYIIVDPGSTDGSRGVIARYSGQIDLTILQKDTGPADGLNRGFRRASGDILGFINSDDILLPGALAKVAQAFALNHDKDVLCGSGFMIDERECVMRTIVPTRISAKRMVYGGATIFQPGLFFRRTVFQKVGGFNESNRTCWDGELIADMAIAGARFFCLYTPLAAFRLHPKSISGSATNWAEYQRDQDRLFLKVVRRDRRGVDQLLSLGYRTVKVVEALFQALRHEVNGRGRGVGQRGAS